MVRRPNLLFLPTLVMGIACGGTHPLTPATAPDGGCVPGAFHGGAGGVCACQAGVPDVCATGCVNLQLDPDHCGDCASRCPTWSVCNDGRCSAPPIVILAAPAAAAAGGMGSCGPLRLQTTEGVVYWTDTMAGTVSSMPTTGGPTGVIAHEQAAPTLLQVIGTSIFWLNSGTKTIMRSTRAGSAPAPVVTALDTDVGIRGFAVTPDGLTVYFSSSKASGAVVPRGTVSKVAASGGTATVVGTAEQGDPAALAIEGANIAFLDDRSGFVEAITLLDGNLAQCELPSPNGADNVGINCTRIAQGRAGLLSDSVVVADGEAYFVDGTALWASLLSKYDLHQIAFSSGENEIGAFAVDGTSAYFAEDGRPSSCHSPYSDGICGLAPHLPVTALVEKTALVADSTAVALARYSAPAGTAQPTAITSVAVDATSVYYATGECSIFKVAR